MDSTEFRSLYDAYYLDVLQFVRGVVRDQADIEEVVQDTFLRVASQYNRFRHDSSIRTWVLAIARNAAIDAARSADRRARNLKAALPSLSIEKSAPGVDEEVIQRDECERAQHVLLQLPMNMRMVIVCRIHHGLNSLETAEVMNWTAGRVRVTYSRALAKFQSLWARQSNARVHLPNASTPSTTGPGNHPEASHHNRSTATSSGELMD